MTVVAYSFKSITFYKFIGHSTERVMKSTSTRKLLFRLFLYNSLAIVLFLELSATFVFYSPSLLLYLPKSIASYFQTLYWSSVVPMPQLEPACSSFDSRLGYVLRPDISCQLASKEFSVEITTNSQGFRDDERSLDSPQVLVLGDSTAFGWGVEQKDTFSQILEDEIGQRVLNLGVPSYGTARELKAVESIDLSTVSLVIIQYNANDANENTQQVRNGMLAQFSQEYYENIVLEYTRSHAYFPGKYAGTLLTIFVQNFRNSWAPHQSPLQQVSETAALAEVIKLFVNPSTQSLAIVILDIPGASDLGKRHSFVESLTYELEKRRLDQAFSSLKILDTTSLFTDNDYFPLDGHLTESGHRKLAKALSRHVKGIISP